MTAPSVGRIVHYVAGAICTAAIITVPGDFPSLHVFYPAGNPDSWSGADKAAVKQSEAHEHGTWHWPERTPE